MLRKNPTVRRQKRAPKWSAAPAAPEKVYDRRHAQEIERAENIAAGLPPEGAPSRAGPATEEKLEAPEPGAADSDAGRGGEAIPTGADGGEAEGHCGFHPQWRRSNLVKKVQRLIKPEKKLHKEVIINAETLETRVAVSEDGKLEEFNIERTTEERLVGSIFKGKVRNLAGRLESGVRGHRFREKCVPALLGHRAEQLRQRRGNRGARRPSARQAENHAEGHPARLSAGQRNHRAGHQGADRHQRVRA